MSMSEAGIAFAEPIAVWRGVETSSNETAGQNASQTRVHREGVGEGIDAIG